MRCVIVLNGEKTCDFDFFKDDFVIACDAAYGFLKELSVEPNVVLGDFDSLGFTPENALKYPVEKDMTDGELAVEYVKDRSFDEIVFICFGGKREDHFLGNLSLLVKCSAFCKNVWAETRLSRIRLLKKGSYSFRIGVGKTVSLFTFSSCRVLSSEGLKYEYRDTLLKCDSTLGISNEVTSENVSLDIAEGSAFFIDNHD